MKKVISTLRIAEINGLADSIVAHYRNESGLNGDAFLSGVMAEVEALSAKITAAIRQDRAVSSLDEADTVRDNAVKSLGTLLEGYAAIPLAGKRASAQRLLTVFAKYGKSITFANYTAESALIKSMLEDFAKADAADIQNLPGVAESLAEIRAAQEAFSKTSVEYTQAASSKVESATSVKKPLVSAINDRLVPYLNTMAMVDGAGYGGFSRHVETEIAKMNETVGKRKKGGSPAPSVD
ncbi:hypothetical protein SAMN05720469_102163 [Fibrobacter intestinalis]|uniref:Uncharacterized protein n=1 Tax=Fibrobacter intestinalis TaxID=28122 RepID=A0A1M6QML1_9BACT|nr:MULTISPECIES: DUF6261 family protein [Fibrobacter]MDD7298167.1 DUF6261 family protein [Fibrobacter intestinalis]PBC68176.1 hypothetical protein BGX14_0524 [Fibrobacter sp. UWS1]SHK21492.1 hypothetical protein SAMN05720469_102163 [Fibrobacter intestinalis]